MPTLSAMMKAAPSTGEGRMMAEAIVRVQTPEEREYARYLGEVEVRKRRAADLQAELEALTVGLARFEAEYHARVGVLFVELDRARLALDEYERRIARLQMSPSTDPSQIEEDVREAFAGRREEVDHEEEETRRYERAFARERERPRLDAAGEDEVARLYRELARRYHPDLARTKEERRRRGPAQRAPHLSPGRPAAVAGGRRIVYSHLPPP